jgi:hypothetical protein
MERAKVQHREGRLAVLVKVRADARKTTTTLYGAVLDSQRGERHVPTRHTIRRSSNAMGERFPIETVLREVTTKSVLQGGRVQESGGKRHDPAPRFVTSTEVPVEVVLG